MTPEEWQELDARVAAFTDYRDLKNFVAESNRIEGIHRSPLPAEVAAHRRVLSLEVLTVNDIKEFVATIQPDAVLRNRAGLNVRVGNHIAPPGGADILRTLTALLSRTDELHPYELHHQYETLHPFTDGNGRSGRVIWLWMTAQRGGLERALALGFLHLWYYESLEHGRAFTRT